MYEHLGRLPVKLWDVTLFRPEVIAGQTIKYENIEAHDEMGAIAIAQGWFEVANGTVGKTARWMVTRSK